MEVVNATMLLLYPGRRLVRFKERAVQIGEAATVVVHSLEPCPSPPVQCGGMSSQTDCMNPIIHPNHQHHQGKYSFRRKIHFVYVPCSRPAFSSPNLGPSVHLATTTLQRFLTPSHGPHLRTELTSKWVFDRSSKFFCKMLHHNALNNLLR